MSDLNTNLIAYWALEEASGSDRADATGNGHTFAEDSAVAQVAGKVGNAASFVTGNDRLTCSTIPARSGDMTWAGWFNPRSGVDPTGQEILGRSSDFTLSWQFDGLGLTERFSWTVYSSVSSYTIQTEVTPDTWHFVVVEYNSTTLNARMKVDNGTTWASVTTTGTAIQSTGAVNAGTSYDRSIDELGVWDRLLTDLEIGALYNGNAGVTYPLPIGVSSTWVVPQPARVGAVKPTSVASSWVVPAPSQVGAVEPTSAASTWVVPAPQRVGTVRPSAVASSWVVPPPALVGHNPNNKIKIGDVSLVTGSLDSEVLV